MKRLALEWVDTAIESTAPLDSDVWLAKGLSVTEDQVIVLFERSTLEKKVR